MKLRIMQVLSQYKDGEKVVSEPMPNHVNVDNINRVSKSYMPGYSHKEGYSLISMPGEMIVVKDKEEDVIKLIEG